MIVDDEVLARDLLRTLLASHHDIEIVAECRNGAEAIDYLRSRPVDLLFLDVEMPKMDGFDVVRQVGLIHLPPIVFTTAFHEYAVRAFEIQAVDYLTKPIDETRFQLALTRVREKIAAKDALLSPEQLAGLLEHLQEAKAPLNTSPDRLLVRDGEREILLPVEHIDWIEAAEYYCCLHVGSRSYMLRETISDLEQRLDRHKFLRIHRSTIVRIDQIKEIFREGQSEGSVVLQSGCTLRMSRRGRQRLAEYGSL
ncbi:LytTR family DNA-binding domain-containing protein [Granulicella sp. 5B5]|uniref:LytR/AlgR family response regulator transcription factor n=1 Tax=Granulicella sp. 5B5 TaxID=1617967 RepID=UPI002107FEAC|nr:LytTR family DNA-binding domain-containing protein [Granulicella sp. 5B5]